MSADLDPDFFNREANAMRVWLRLLRLESRVRFVMGSKLRAVGLSLPQCDILTILSVEEGISQQDLAEKLYVTKGNISGLIDRLEAAGLVERHKLPTDRRSYSIHMTPAGREAAARGLAVQREFIDTTIGCLSDTQLSDLESLIIATRRLVREKTEKVE
jgi:DNA-binding MarR family transcriptional regulator